MITKKRVIGLLDLTSLNEDDTLEKITKLCKKANNNLVAAVCVYPQFVAQTKSIIKKNTISIATVVNFPNGNQKKQYILKEIEESLDNGANEIDLVIPYQDYLKSGVSNQSLQLVTNAKKLLKNRYLKVILETGELKQKKLIYTAAKDALSSGADFIKTSTGKTTTGATLEAVSVMLQAIKDNKNPTKGLKISGGVRTTTQAMEYIQLAQNTLGKDFITPDFFRIGASSLLDDLLK